MAQAQSGSWTQAALSLLGLKSSTDQKMEGSDVQVTQPTLKPACRLDEASGSTTQNDFVGKLSRINGAVNKLTKEQLQEKLNEIGLNSCGVKDVLKKRLKNYYKRQKSAQTNRALTEDEIVQFDYLVVIDYEATCNESNDNFVHEIIEFPAVLVDTRQQRLGDTFQRYCKPVLNPRLTPFCTDLTGITQSQVDQAQPFPVVLAEFEQWMASHKLGSQHKFAILTDGPWDMARFLAGQCELSDVPFPRWARQWINLRKAYSGFYGCGKVNLQHMLQDLGMTFQGRPHCGLDDAYNIASIALRLLMDGSLMRVNEYRQKKGGGSSSSQSQNSRQRSPTKSRLTKAQGQSNGEGRQSSRNKTEVVDVPQEGDNLEDLIQYLRIQKS